MPAEQEHMRGMDAYNKEDEMEILCNCQSETDRHGGDKAFIARLQRDLATTYYWSGDFCKDYGFFVCNWHPLLGMFLAHPAHPWSKGERLATFILSCCLTMLPSALLAHALADHPAMEKHTLYYTFVLVTLPVMTWEIMLYWISIGEDR